MAECLGGYRGPTLPRSEFDSTPLTLTGVTKLRTELMTSPEKFLEWTHALDERHLSNLTLSEAARALRALSSCYVERRDKLAKGDALGSAGKRAAFALFYAPLHFLVARAVVQALGSGDVARIVDLGCGTGAAGAAWALEAGSVPIVGFDVHPWAVAEASWTYRTLGLQGSARRADVARLRLRAERRSGVIAAYTVNELKPDARTALLPQLIDAGRRGSRILVLEPISRRVAPWWREWEEAFAGAGGRADEWRFPAALPERQAQLARAAGLDPKELTGRTLSL
jgi:Methyltransferase domain